MPGMSLRPGPELAPATIGRGKHHGTRPRTAAGPAANLAPITQQASRASQPKSRFESEGSDVRPRGRAS